MKIGQWHDVTDGQAEGRAWCSHKTFFILLRKERLTYGVLTEGITQGSQGP
jgi:hypothetical protein